MQRRTFLTAATGTLAVATSTGPLKPASADDKPHANALPVRLCLNTSTISGQKLSLPEQVNVCAGAGYRGIEPWIRDLRKYVEEGGRLSDLKKQIEDAGLTVESAIGFASWIVDDETQRQAGLEEGRRDMEMVLAIGGTRLAAPPVGATKTEGMSLDVIAQRYRALLEVGRQIGVKPQLELWGFSKTLSKLSELAYVATGAEHDDACVLPDFYHIYKGNSQFSGLGMIEAGRMHVFHINDYPDTPVRETINDAARVFPGDGVCPLVETIAMLIANGFRGAFSLELFNPEYWKRDASEVAREGFEKSLAVVQQAIEHNARS
ncbi:MAG: sugar phosphate isomerase/epimerase family protein [Planctomycetaceae bacterium]